MNLTKKQKQILDLDKVSENSINIICGSVIFDKKLDIQAMTKAVNELFRINDALRTKIIRQNGSDSQVIEDFKEKNIEVVWFSDKHELHKYAQNQASAPFDINGSLCEIKILASETFSGVLYKLHHIISDAWTLSLLASQFNKIMNGEEFEVFSYKDHIEADAKYFLGKRCEKDKAFYLEQFQKQPEPVFLSQTPTKTSSAKRKSYHFQSDILSLYEFLNNNSISPATFFLTIISIFYSKFNNNTERFYLGMPIINRIGHIEKNTVGLFINTAPVLIDLNPNVAFSENLTVIDESLVSVMRHQKYTYEDILIDLKENFGFTGKLFDMIFSYQNAQICGDSFKSTWYHNGAQRESLQIHIDDRDNTGAFTFHYDYQIENFTENDIDNIHNYICNLIFDALENPDKRITDLEMLSSEEKQKLLFDFNNTQADYEKHKCIHELFEEQAEKTPDKVAVVACDKTLTYRELNEEANRIAHSLMEKGIGKGDIVGLMLPRKSYLLSALFGILKTGAAYLPIDPDFPEGRIEYMLSDSQAKHCITEENISELLSNTNTSTPKAEINSSDICYCIYTSGSTGKPKGTLLTHRNVVNYVSCNEKNICYGITGKDCRSILSVTTVGFDIFVTESLLPLSNGMEIVLADENQAKLQSKLNELIENHPAYVLQTTPTKMKTLMTHKDQLEYLKKFKVIILGGEALDSNLVKKLKETTDAKIYNIYGPTETTVWVTYAEIKDADITIGKPIANTQVYIIDKHMNPVPVGVTGELCIAGDSVAAGYLNRPDLTAEKFIDNPFGEGKLYRTGDNAYFREDGNIIFVGRSDFQVKIRGLRIELGEIESVLQSVEGVDRAVVVVRKDKEGRQLICAFYTGKEKSAKELREEMGKSLPKYMVPHIFTYLEEMPLTTSGKVNRNALPEINLENIITETEYVAPETEKEKLLIECIEDVLGTEKVGVLDNFFDIGGDSLKSIELTARLEEKGYTAAVKTIFSCKDIKELATMLEEKQQEEKKIEYGNVIPATAAQMRVYTAQMLAPDSTLYNVTYAFKTDDIDISSLENAVNELIARHESLRTHFENRNGKIVQVIDEASEIKVQKLTEDEIYTFSRAFDLSCSPLIRVGCSKDTVIIGMHHITVDGETMPTLFRELNELYMGRELPEAAVQYGEFAVTETDTEESEKYWLDIFSEEVPSLELPTDFARKEAQSFNGNVHYERIDITLHDKIKDKSKELGITPYVFYMACFNILLSKYSGNEDIVVGMPISGRSSRYLDTVGMFVNTIALRSKPEGNKTVEELLTEIKDSSIEAIDNQSYPFGELVKKLNIEVGGRNPLYDVMLAYQSYEMTDITFGDRKVELLPLPATNAKCDLTFNILPRENDVVLAAEYCTDLYIEKTVQKLTHSFRIILEKALDENALIKDISVTDMSVVDRFNDTAYDYDIPENSNIYSLFEKNAKENKSKICISTAEGTVTFGELLSLSENLDGKIRSITQNKKSVIAVIAERSIEMYAAIYGIIRGGNAYLPIDPDYPQDRIEYILENSGAVLVICQGKFAHLAGVTTHIDMSEFIKNPTISDTLLPCAAEADDTAYVIYTSGSTGNPKGSKISHKSAVNRILWMQDMYHTEENSVILQKTPYTFDVSVWELFWWGMCGGSLAVSKPGEHFLPAKILDETCNRKVTHLHFVPSVFELFLNYLESHKDECYKFNSVKHVFLSGETLTASLIERFYNLFDFSEVKLHNLYGPTECAVDVTYYDCNPADIDPVPIGKPIYNTQMYVVDKHMKPVPVEVTGELCIAGINVGQGYHNKPELTAEKFIDNPFGEGKLYRTGDNAYFREDGNIIFVGRSDFQIKLNGQRIEIGEIESVIAGIDAVDSVAVIVKRINDRDVLVAFYTGKESSEILIKEACSNKLPKYMVPGNIVHLDALPLNQSGKLDRKALSQKEILTVLPVEDNTPINDTERLICETFKMILGEENIGRNSDFFEIGGDSLSMISFLSEEEYEEITTAEFMRNPTPAKLARVLKNKKKLSIGYLEPLYEPEETKQSLIIFPFAGGGAEAYSNYVNSLKSRRNDISVYFIRYLHSIEECKCAADEIADILGDTEILMYSHCVGSAISLQILKFLEPFGVNVKHYFAAANLPPSKPTKRNIWNIVPDSVLKRILSNAGAKLGELSDEKASELLKRFRKNTDFANISFTETDSKTKVPVSVIISKKDRFTKNYEQAEKLWKNYAEEITGVHFIDSDSHYFQSDNSEELIELILSLI